MYDNKWQLYKVYRSPYGVQLVRGTFFIVRVSPMGTYRNSNIPQEITQLKTDRYGKVIIKDDT